MYEWTLLPLQGSRVKTEKYKEKKKEERKTFVLETVCW